MFNLKEWLKYMPRLHLALRGELTEFERTFLKSIHKRLGLGLSQKQSALLDKILSKYFKKQ